MSNVWTAFWLAVCVLMMVPAYLQHREQKRKMAALWRELVEKYGEEELRGLSLMEIRLALRFGLLRPRKR